MPDRPRYEYKVLGMGTADISGQTVCLHTWLGPGGPAGSGFLERDLSLLGSQGWEPVTLEFPYIFKRLKADDDISVAIQTACACA